MNRLAAVLAALLLSLGAPAIASAQFGPDAPAPLLQQDPNAAPFEEDGGLSTLQLVLIFGGAAIAVGLIAWIIVRDARRRAAPKRSGSKSGSGSRPAATLETSPKSSAAKAAREREREKARKRNKAKAARNQRKHNRPR